MRIMVIDHPARIILLLVVSHSVGVYYCSSISFIILPQEMVLLAFTHPSPKEWELTAGSGIQRKQSRSIGSIQTLITSHLENVGATRKREVSPPPSCVFTLGISIPRYNSGSDGEGQSRLTILIPQYFSTCIAHTYRNNEMNGENFVKKNIQRSNGNSPSKLEISRCSVPSERRIHACSL